jgi:hypothetical protein
MNSEVSKSNKLVPIFKSASIRNKSSSLSIATTLQSYVPFNKSNFHVHDHRLTPHIHSFECERYSSGYDKSRNYRFYFTKTLTPVRVYMTYANKSSKFVLPSINEEVRQVKDYLNGRKLGAEILKNQLRLKPELIEDAQNLIFLKDSLSFVPQMETRIGNNVSLNHLKQRRLTMAEMAVLPFIQKSKISSRKNSILSARSL